MYEYIRTILIQSIVTGLHYTHRLQQAHDARDGLGVAEVRLDAAHALFAPCFKNVVRDLSLHCLLYRCL